MTINPFHETKASFFDVPEIIDNWVELGNTKFIDSVMIPSSSIPIRIFGGKGTGKTHILRFFSFQSQVLNAVKNKITTFEQIKQDNYIGIYIEASGLEVNRFSGCGYTDEEWKATFYYYFNLELIERVLKKLNQIVEPKETKFDFSNAAEYFFDEDKITELSTISEFYKYIRTERKNIDSQIGDLSTPGNRTTLSINPLFKIENLFKEIVTAVINVIDSFEKIKILYIIDEIENFSITQQKYINTLVRHVGGSNNVSLRLAGRLYGNKTSDTLDAGQKLLENAEVKTIYLEDILAPSFKIFAQRLYEKRIEIASNGEEQVDLPKILQRRQECDNEYISKLQNKHKGKERIDIKKLKENLINYKKYKQSEVDLIITNLICEDNWLIEKMNIYLLFQEWNKDLIQESIKIKESSEKYKNNKKPSRHYNAFEKHGLDMKYQLFRNYGSLISYSGYEEIIKMSHNNPRIFLSILDNLYSTCSFNGIDFFTSETIPCGIQEKALVKSSNWFWDNFTTEVKDAKVLKALIGLCEFFRLYRRSDKPVEKNAIIFSYKEGELLEIQSLINIAIDNSLLIEQGRRKDRSTGEFKRNLRLHPMLSPEWELPVGGGGTVSLTKEILLGLFVNETDINLREYSKEMLELLNVPFKNKQKQKEEEEKKRKQEVIQQSFIFEDINND